METLSLEKKQSWVESSPTKVFDIDPVTQQVSVCFLLLYLFFPFLLCVLMFMVLDA